MRYRLHDVYGRIPKTSVSDAVDLRRMLHDVCDFYQRHCNSFRCPQNVTGFLLGFPTFPDIVNECMWTLMPHPQSSGDVDPKSAKFPDPMVLDIHRLLPLASGFFGPDPPMRKPNFSGRRRRPKILIIYDDFTYRNRSF